MALSACGANSTASSTAATRRPDRRRGGTITMWVDAERAPALKDITAKFKGTPASR